MSSFADTISDKHQKEFENLKRSRQKTTGQKVLIGFAAFFALAFVVMALSPNWADVTLLEKYRRELNSSGVPWARDLTAQQESLRGWIRSHGTGGETAIFNTISEMIFSTGVDLTRKAGEAGGLGILSQIYLKLIFGLMRVAFIFVACWRLWLVAVVGTWVWGTYSLKVFESDDMLGMTGNGRAFYSGIRAGLHKVTSFGAPDVQVTGLACPTWASEAAVKSSELGKLLEEHGVSNETNRSLAAILLNYEKWPSYIAQQDEDALLEKFYKGANLVQISTAVLREGLTLHKFYLDNEDPLALPPFLAGNGLPAPQEKIDHETHARLLQHAMHRVLTPHMRKVIKEITPNELATFMLAHEAGKVLTYAFQGGRWLRRSNYGQLNSRAILHSVPGYNREYGYEPRMTIRRALIYGQRMGAFAPVHLPIDLSDKSRTLRQWMELLMACPYELQSVADEVEMLGIVNELHKGWSQRFMEGAMTMDPDVVQGTYATQANLFFMPVPKVLKLVRSLTTPQTLSRLEELVGVVNQRQRLKAMSMDFGESGGPPQDNKSNLPAYARIFTPFTHQEIKSLSELHDLAPADVKAWSSVRVMLNSFGWLGRRVGEHSVPESSVVFVVLKMPERSSETNELGLIGKSGMIPFRGTRLEDKWGSFWQSRFTLANSAAMSENREYYDRLIRGLPDPRDDELAAINAAMGQL